MLIVEIITFDSQAFQRSYKKGTSLLNKVRIFL